MSVTVVFSSLVGVDVYGSVAGVMFHVRAVSHACHDVLYITSPPILDGSSKLI